jgi:hypothetical protein
MEPLVAALLILFSLAVLCGLVAFAVSCDAETREQREAREAAERKATIARLKDENQILGLKNAITAKQQLGELTPLKIEAKGVGLVQRRDERLLEIMAGRQAMMQLFEQIMLGRTPRTIDGDPIATAAAALADEIEQRKADGEETADLETALDLLRSRR